MTRSLLAHSLCLTLLSSAAACDHSDPSDELPVTATKTVSSAKSAMSAAPFVTGSAPTLPAALKGVKPGTPTQEAEEIFPRLDNGRLRLKEYPKNPIWLYTPRGQEKIKLLKITVPASTLRVATEKWGTPVMLDDLGKKVPAWFNPESNLMARLKPGIREERADLVFTEYVPYKKLVGESAANIAFQAKHPLLGAGIEDLRKNYPNALREVSLAQAEAQRKRIKSLAGKKANLLGKVRPSVHLEFPPTEYGSQFTRVNFYFDKNGRVQSFRFNISYRANPEDREAMKSFFTSAWGPSKEINYLGREAQKWGAKPATYLVDNKITKSWDVEVTAKPRY